MGVVLDYRTEIYGTLPTGLGRVQSFLHVRREVTAYLGNTSVTHSLTLELHPCVTFHSQHNIKLLNGADTNMRISDLLIVHAYT